MGWTNNLKSFFGTKKEIVEQQISASFLGMVGQETVDIFRFLVNRFLTPTIRIGDIQATLVNEETNNKLNALCNSVSQQKIERFVKLYGVNYSRERISGLKQEIDKELSVANDEMEYFVALENEQQSYQMFKDIMSNMTVNDFKRYLRRFVEVYGKQIKLLDDFQILQTIFKEEPDAQKRIEKLSGTYIQTESVMENILPNAENLLETYRTVARKAQHIHFFLKLLSEQKNDVPDKNTLSMNEVVDLILDETKKQQWEGDELIISLTKIIAPSSTLTFSCTNPNYLYAESYEKIKLSKCYGFLVSYAKKYNCGSAEDNKRNLAELFNSKGVQIDIKELDALINLEVGNQEFMDFTKLFTTTTQPLLLEELIKLYSLNYSNELKQYESCVRNFDECGFGEDEEGNTFINKKIEDKQGNASYVSVAQLTALMGQIRQHLCYLMAFIRKNNIAMQSSCGEKVESKDIVKMILKMKEEMEKAHFEKSLLDEEFYSIERVDLMSGYEFESFLKTVFEKMNYTVQQTKLSGDQGADLVISKFGEIIVVQAKRWGGAVGNSAIQEVVAAIKHYGAHKGMVVANTQFTNSAVELAKSNQITLIDREELKKWIQQYL